MSQGKDFKEKLVKHIWACPLCQGKNELSQELEKEHDEWSTWFKEHIKECEICKPAKNADAYCDLAKIFVNQDYRNIKGAVKNSRTDYNVLPDGAEKEILKIYVKGFDSRILNSNDPSSNPEEAEISQHFFESGHAGSIYDLEEYIPQGTSKKLRRIFKAWLLGFSQKEIAKKHKASQQLISLKLDELKKSLVKKSIQRPLYSEEVESGEN